MPSSSEQPTSTGLLAAVEVMNRLRSAGGCPWDAKQTHQSLARYLLEEAYETVDAIEAGDRDNLREELGDVLLQVLFHARIAQEYEQDPWGVDDVADDLVAKLVRRHPHVFADTTVAGATEVAANWETIKAAEKGRTAPYDGVVWSQPALSLAAQVLNKAGRAGLSTELAGDPADARARIGRELLAVVRAAAAEGVDPELALRAVVRQLT